MCFSSKAPRAVSIVSEMYKSAESAEYGLCSFYFRYYFDPYSVRHFFGNPIFTWDIFFLEQSKG